MAQITCVRAVATWMVTSDLFDVYDVFDRRRPLPVNGITVPEDFDLQALADSLGMSDRIIN